MNSKDRHRQGASPSSDEPVLSDDQPHSAASGSASSAREPAQYYPPGAGYGGGYYYGMGYGEQVGGGGGVIAGLSPTQIMRAVLRKWWLVFLAVLFGGSAAVFYLHQAEPVYRADATIEMSIRRPRIMAQPGAMIEDGFAGWRVEELLNTRLRKLQGHETRAIARQILEERGHTRRADTDQLDAALRTARMSRQRDSHLVSVAAESTNPDYAALAANVFAEAAVLRSIQENRIESDQAVAWLQQQAAHQAVMLEQAEEALLNFRAGERMSQLEIEKRIIEESVISMSDELTRVEKLRLMSAELMAQLERPDMAPDEFGHLPESTPHLDDILRAVSQWDDAGSALRRLGARMTERHPEYIEQQSRVEQARSRVRESIHRSRAVVKANMALYEQQARGLRERIHAQSDAATEIEGRLAQLRTRLSALERTRDSADVSFKGLLTRIEEARLAADENTSIVHLIEEARTPGAPFYPRRHRALLIGLFSGAVLGVGLALGIYLLEDGIEGTEAIERAAGLKVIGLVPHAEISEPKDLADMALSKDYHPLVEAFANLRAMLESEAYRANTTSILVTSTAPREGKTAAATNLAISLARAGHRTCLIGFDLRKPRMRPIFDIPDGHPSLTTALKEGENADYAELPYQVKSTLLWVISSRHGSESSASEVLGSRAVASVVEWATAHYDRVIIDSPPYSLIGDALVLAGHVSGVLLVCRPSITRMRALRHVARDFSEAGVRMLGILVNDIEFKRSSYFSNYHYYDNHAYRYAHRYYEVESRDPHDPARKGIASTKG